MLTNLTFFLNKSQQVMVNALLLCMLVVLVIGLKL